jgi:hypothetical protein
MVEFMGHYLPAMDQFEQRPVEPIQADDIEQPLIPIGDIGTTSVDAGQGNILQNLESNIKMGAKKLQIVFTPGRGGISSGPTSFGKEVRQSLFEKAEATGAEIIGVELSPAMISGLAGFDPQSGRITEERRHADMRKVKDAIRFAADVSKGGCVDLWSQEFNRNITDAKWNNEGRWAGQFYDESETDLQKDKQNLLKYLIDKRNGQPIQASAVRTGEKVQELVWMTAKDYDDQFKTTIVGKTDSKGNKIKEGDFVDFKGDVVDMHDKNATDRLVPFMDPKDHSFKTREVTWETMEKRAKDYNAKNGTTWTTEEYLYRQKLETEKALLHGQSLHYSQSIEGMYDQLRELAKFRDRVERESQGMGKDEREEYLREVLIPRIKNVLGGVNEDRLLQMDPTALVDDAIQRQKNIIHGYQEQATSYRIKHAEIKEMEDSIATPQSFAFQKSTESYAEMGIDAMQVTKERELKKDIYIGPELGWASQSFGGHPQEFIDLIKESRKKMAEKLEKEHGLSTSEAAERAKRHIKGMVDTSHLAMWYKHFKRNPGDTDEQHLSRFKGWMKEQAVAMVKAGVVGGVQVVDSITGEHSHLPAGQGVFDVADFVKEMKKAGFDGPIIAEGHEEDTGGFGSGRILTETWKAFGSNIASVGGYRMGMRGWGGIQHAYFGHVTPPTYIVGAYAPSNEWSLWSETPFE